MADRAIAIFVPLAAQETTDGGMSCACVESFDETVTSNDARLYGLLLFVKFNFTASIFVPLRQNDII
jgi:hypothetical protein